MTNFAFDADFPNGFQVQVTENYEGNRYHVVVFDRNREHFDTRGFQTVIEVFNFMRECSEQSEA